MGQTMTLLIFPQRLSGIKLEEEINLKISFGKLLKPQPSIPRFRDEKWSHHFKHADTFTKTQLFSMIIGKWGIGIAIRRSSLAGGYCGLDTGIECSRPQQFRININRGYYRRCQMIELLAKMATIYSNLIPAKENCRHSAAAYVCAMSQI